MFLALTTQLAKVFLNRYYEQRVSGLPSHIPVQSSSYEQRTMYMYGHDNNSCFKLIAKAEQLYGIRPRQHLCQYKEAALSWTIMESGRCPSSDPKG